MRYATRQKYMTSHRPTGRTAGLGPERIPPAGPGGLAAIHPPSCGIDFVDRGTGSEAAISPAAEENRTGMPDRLKGGLELLSGLDLSGLRVRYNSGRPARVNARAYTQGRDIEVGPGQEKHLPHEGWHAVQQMQGRVKPTMQEQGVWINDDEGLEREADVMGARALQTRLTSAPDLLVMRPRAGHARRRSRAIQRSASIYIDETFTITAVDYHRDQNIKSLLMGEKGKHATADAAQKSVYEIGLLGKSVRDGLLHAFYLSNVYIDMPGNSMISTHGGATKGGIAEKYIDGYKIYQDQLGKLKKWQIATEKKLDEVVRLQPKDVSELENLQMSLLLNNGIHIISKFRELLPLVSLSDPYQSGSGEGWSNTDLMIIERLGNDAVRDAAIHSRQGLLDMMGNLFDVETIDLINGGDGSEESLRQNLKDTLPWLDVDSVGKNAKKIGKLKPYRYVADAVIRRLIRNHITQMSASFPAISAALEYEVAGEEWIYDKVETRAGRPKDEEWLPLHDSMIDD